MAKLLAALLLALACGACLKYTCKSPPDKLDPSICAFFDHSLSTWFLNACDSGYVCPAPDTLSLKSSYCVQSPPETKPLSYPGEKCEYDSDCELYASDGLACTSGYCAGKILSAACGSSYECNPGLTCFGTCQSQAKEGGVCIYDSDCVNTCACDNVGTQQGKCTEYFSIASGDPVSSCPGPQFSGTSFTFLNLLCESGTCASDATGAVCVDAFTSKGALPVNCTQNSDCVSSPESTYTALSSCSACGYNLAQSTFCSLFPGDTLFSSLLSITEDWLSSSSLAKCNTSRRFDCMATMWSNYEKWAYYQAATNYYPMVVEAENCVPAVLFPSFYALEVQENAAWCLGAFAFILVN